MTALEPCHFLAWDSAFFDLRIARVQSREMTPLLAQAVIDWCTTHRIDCLYLLARCDDDATVRTAEAHAFHLVDIRMTLTCALRTTPSAVDSHTIRASQPDDIETLKMIARNSHTDSRFYYDPHFPRERCDALYTTWIEQDCLGKADIVLTAIDEHHPVGYLSCHVQGTVGTIGLVGIAASHRGRGIGSQLLKGALHWFTQQAVTHVEVVTQARNIGAQRLYQRSGFVTEHVEYWYHRWFSM